MCLWRNYFVNLKKKKKNRLFSLDFFFSRGINFAINESAGHMLIFKEIYIHDSHIYKQPKGERERSSLAYNYILI